ncbi:MAG TPA: hypothetical protein VN025_20385 [Candidatus Dormibacteraeota bacterium]|jgi:hypothetical protein|nr:hypothetical protein [Candidatus Dormibacteraeota bacterium]
MDNFKSNVSRYRVACGLASLALLPIFVPGQSSGQACPSGKPNLAALAHGISRAASQFAEYNPEDLDNSGPPVNANIIYRSAAIGGRDLIPILRRVSRPGFSPEEVPGAAQVSLSKFGVRRSLTELKQELDGKLGTGPWWAPRKLARVGNDVAFGLLLTHLEVKSRDASRYVIHSDYGEDPLLEVVYSLSAFDLLLDAPTHERYSEAAIQIWVDWWNTARTKQNFLAISERPFADSRLQCLARKISWGYPYAILDLADSGDKRVGPLLTDLLRVGDKSEAVGSFDTVRGLAQTGLAILGDRQQFDLIVHELDTLQYKDATRKLVAIGGEHAVSTLILGFDSPTFLADRPDYTGDKEHIGGIINDRDRAIAYALTLLVVTPPDNSGDSASKATWTAWWSTHSLTAKFTPRPKYE